MQRSPLRHSVICHSQGLQVQRSDKCRPWLWQMLNVSVWMFDGVSFILDKSHTGFTQVRLLTLRGLKAGEEFWNEASQESILTYNLSWSKVHISKSIPFYCTLSPKVMWNHVHIAKPWTGNESRKSPTHRLIGYQLTALQKSLPICSWKSSGLLMNTLIQASPRFQAVFLLRHSLEQLIQAVKNVVLKR